MFSPIIDKQLSLRLIDVTDAEGVFFITNRSREYLRKWLQWVDATKTVEDTKKFIDTSFQGYMEKKSMTTVIIFKEEIAGVASFNQIDWVNQVASIGYWLDKDHQGMGIMTKVVRTLTEYAFCEMDMNRVEIRAAVQNQRSRAIPERLGFVKEGHLRQTEWLYNRYVDHVIYGMLTEDWKEN